MKVSLVLLATSACCSSASAFLLPRSSTTTMVSVHLAAAVDANDPDAIYVADFMSKMTMEMEEEQDTNDDDDDDDEDDDDDDYEPSSKNNNKNKNSNSMSTKRWDQLTPLTKSRLKKEAVERKLANNRVESKADKKRRLMFVVKESQRARKKASRVDRKIPFGMRTPLAALSVGSEMNGTVISLTNFGAYVDIGTTVDGLLHISQMSRTLFVQHPKEILQPGDDLVVTVASVNPELKKLHLSLLSNDVIQSERELVTDTDRIALQDVMVDDELWGKVVRVTDYGSYVEVGAVVQGFLHFMDHPLFGDGAHPSTFMKVGERVRVWVADVDSEHQRIKLTANRPKHLPGPKRELF